jgi:hypothetical protein
MGPKISRLGMIAGVLIFGLFLLAGCGDKKSEQKKSGDVSQMTIKDSTGKEVNVNMQQGKIEIEGKGGKAQIMDTSTWPADMFPEAPLFAFGQVKHVQKHQQPDGLVSFIVVLGNVQGDAIGKYSELLKTAGWQLTLTAAGEKSGMIGAKRGKLGMTVTFNAENKEAAVMVNQTK